MRIRSIGLGIDDLSVARILFKLAAIHRSRGENDKAVKAYEESLRIRKLELGENSAEVAATYFNLGCSQDLVGKDKKALFCYKKAINICIKLSDGRSLLVAKALVNQARILMEHNKSENALSCFDDAIKIREELEQDEPSEEMADILFDQGKIYDLLDNKQAVAMYEKALIMYESTVGHEHLSVGKVLHAMAVYYYNNGDHEQAHETIKEAVRLRETMLTEDNEETADSFYVSSSMRAYRACILRPMWPTGLLFHIASAGNIDIC